MELIKLRRHPSGACCVIKMCENFYVLVSYATIVASCWDGRVSRHWRNSSRTTSKHFYAFCREYADSWARWDEMPCEDFPLEYRLEAFRGKLVDDEAQFMNYTHRNGGVYFRIKFLPKLKRFVVLHSEKDCISDDDIEEALTTAKFVKELKGKND